ncbi:hypothetical protein [Sphingomonas phyllosphaerae]|uniref:hypothetical protein n=1 Tax=Sphingomonas phyllosphaerae TaxID=257003 RepID=UPI0003B37880|nr:hypothetical protein [Sphingomonas phyllosphaerae]
MDYGSRARIAAASSLVLVAADAAAQPAAIPSAPSQPSANPAAADLPAPAAATPALLWQDVTSLGVTCLVHTADGIATGALHDRLCAAVTAQAAKGAPVPVTAAALGGAALAPGRVTLLVQASVEDVRGAGVVALTIRPFRNAAEAGQLFGAPPRVVAADDLPALERAVAGLLAATLPWQAAVGSHARPLPAGRPRR